MISINEDVPINYGYDSCGRLINASNAGNRITGAIPCVCQDGYEPIFSGHEWVPKLTSLVEQTVNSQIPATQFLGNKISSRAFMLRLGMVTLRKIYNAAPTNVDIQIFKDLVLSGLKVDLKDQITIDDLNALNPSILTSEEIDLILNSPVLEKELS